MRLPRIGLPLRTRLTLWYGALLALTLLGFSTLLYFTLERSLSRSMDEALHLRADQVRRIVFAPEGGIPLQPEDIPPGGVEARPLDELAAPGIYVQVLNARGGVVYAPFNLAGGELPVTDAMLDAFGARQETLVDVPVSGANVRVLTVPLLRANNAVAGAVQVGQSLAPLESTMAAVWRLLFTGGTGALLLALVVGWLITQRALSPVARVTETARHIAATGDYRQRLQVVEPHVGRGDELYFLASTFNDMIARLEHMLESQRRLLADTSHELRNPLTVIRGNLALLRRAQVPDRTRREAAQEADEEAARMGRLVDDLLLLARADAGQLPRLQREPVNLAEVVGEVVEQLRTRAAARHLSYQQEVASAVVIGDRDRLKQLVANLVENAVRYTPESGSIHVHLGSNAAVPHLQQVSLPARSLHTEAGVRTAKGQDDLVLTISDTGIGIAPDDLPRLFERFFRVDRARNRAEGGSGLGLPIAQYIAHAHGGNIEATSPGQGQGATFRVRFPRAEMALPPIEPAREVAPASAESAPPRVAAAAVGSAPTFGAGRSRG